MSSNTSVNPVVHETSQAVSMMSCWEYLLVDNVQVWERMVSRARELVKADVTHVDVLIANAIELGHAKRDLENYYV
jgi:hypothetical protein